MLFGENAAIFIQCVVRYISWGDKNGGTQRGTSGMFPEYKLAPLKRQAKCQDAASKRGYFLHFSLGENDESASERKGKERPRE